MPPAPNEEASRCLNKELLDGLLELEDLGLELGGLVGGDGGGDDGPGDAGSPAKSRLGGDKDVRDVLHGKKAEEEIVEDNARV
jgi:hypothetical protein